jgi:hypothetical protein
MIRKTLLAMALLLSTGSTLSAGEYDYFKNAQLPGVRRADVSLDKVTDEAPANGVPTGYQRRTVEWFPKKGVDIVDAPKGALLRTWTINPKSRTSGDNQVKKWWPIPLRDKKQFKAHLLGFRGIGIGIGNPWAKSEERSREEFKTTSPLRSCCDSKTAGSDASRAIRSVKPTKKLSATCTRKR